MYVTKSFNAGFKIQVVVAALRSICNTSGEGASIEVKEAVGMLALQAFQGHPLDAREGTVAAEYIQMIIDHYAHYEYLVEILGH